MSTDFVGESRKEFAARRGRERLSEIQRVRLKTTVVEINMATESFPARHWNHGVELSLLSGLSDSNAIHHRYFRSAEALSREVSEACLLERAGARLIDMVVPSAEQAQTNIHICM